MYRGILVPLDGSAFSEQALPVALRLAAASRAAVHLVHVDVIYPILYVEGLPVIDTELRTLSQAHTHAYMEGVAERARAAHPDLTITVQILMPPIVPSLAEYAETHAIDLVVMTTHGRGGLSRTWLGSVADGLVRRCTVPLLLLRPRPDESPSEADPFTQILIPLDGSPLAEQILEPALALGRLTGARFTLLRVVPPFTARHFLPDSRAREVQDEINRQREAEAHTYLQGVAERLRMEGWTVATQIVRADNIAGAILEAARHDTSTIALTTHGYSGLTRWLLGSIADKVMRSAETPVLLYRPSAAKEAA
ncbi:universal stress protein [Kallotenue papyrolyticum]|uniref:universal stress protein n=1 Tax=Kallotenue papyrolyticum TaxID=1325125 RepID=UPI00047055D1|nr:universal stress protein [Kallotenue papyrolyticum]